MLKKIIITASIIIVIIMIIVFVLLRSGNQPEYVTHTVERGTLSHIVDATGKIESIKRIELNFKIIGQITLMAVMPGDHVTTKQELARLDTQALTSKIADAVAKLNQTQADYEKLLAGASDLDIKVAEDMVAQKKQDVNTAQDNLSALKTTRNTTLNNLKETAITVMNNELATAEGALVEVDNTINDNDAEGTLSIKDSSALTQALISEAQANDAVNTIEAVLSPLRVYSDDALILKLLDSMKDTLYSVAAALSDTLDVLLVTTTSQDLTETELDALKSNIIALQAKINTSQSNLQTAKTNWTNKIVDYQDQIASQENTIKKAEKALQVAQSQLDFKKSPPRQFEIDSAKADIDQANASLSLARANLNEAIITAPLDGTIVKKNYEVGEQSSLSTPVYEMIGESKLQIEVDIPESDIAKIRTGQKTHVTLDALSDDKVFDGTIIFVDPAETIIQDVVYYKIKVQLNNHDDNLKPGMTANILIVTDKKDSVLWIPSRAVKTHDNEKYVTVLENDIPIDKRIATGMRGDQGIEIVSGLSEGEKVITFVKE